MLKKIVIKNFIFIKAATINLTPGFNVITGETGAGKSIFLNALGLTLGERISSSDIIRKGETKAEVESTFIINEGSSILKKLQKLGIEIIGRNLIFKREINREGKSKCFIADEKVSLNDLKEISKKLIDIHSQHQNLNLLKPLFYISFLDRYLNLENELLSYRKEYFTLKKKADELKELLSQEDKLKAEREFLNFTIKELDGKIIPEEEYDSLKVQLKDFEKKQKNQQIISDFKWLIKGDNQKGILTNLEKAHFLLGKFSLNDEKVNQDYQTKITKIIDFFKNLTNKLPAAEDNINYQEKISETNQQLSNIENLKRKYGLSINQLANKLAKSKEKVKQLRYFEEDKKVLLAKKKTWLNKTIKSALNLHTFRKKGVHLVSANIEKHIREMGMDNSKLLFHFERENLSFDEDEDIESYLYEFGLDKIDLHYVPALESNFKPLKEIASGGEISRIMLALKIILTKKLPNNTIIFDEIDSGIGGETALKVGEKIKDLAADKQVLIITHLPQIAKFADSHFKVEKSQEEQTEVEIKHLSSGRDIIKEISRMLGKPTSELSLKLAEEYKNS